MIDIEKIKQAALDATHGEWVFGSFHELLVVPVKDGAPDKYDPIANLGETAIPWDMDTYSAERYKNAEHIATANPSAILELITRLDSAESSNKQWEDSYHSQQEYFLERTTAMQAKLEAAEQDAARYQYLQNIDRKQAQAFFWTYSSRKQRSKAIDANIEAMKEMK